MLSLSSLSKNIHLCEFFIPNSQTKPSPQATLREFNWTTQNPSCTPCDRPRFGYRGLDSVVRRFAGTHSVLRRREHRTPAELPRLATARAYKRNTSTIEKDLKRLHCGIENQAAIKRYPS